MTNDNKVEKQKDENLTNAGGFSYFQSYGYDERENYKNESRYSHLFLTERERRKLTSAGYEFTLNDNGEIEGVLDSKGNALTPQGIADILKSK